eukprot:g70006.t1
MTCFRFRSEMTTNYKLFRVRQSRGRTSGSKSDVVKVKNEPQRVSISYALGCPSSSSTDKWQARSELPHPRGGLPSDNGRTYWGKLGGLHPRWIRHNSSRNGNVIFLNSVVMTTAVTRFTEERLKRHFRNIISDREDDVVHLVSPVYANDHFSDFTNGTQKSQI